MSVQYFISTRYEPPALLRRTSYIDEAFVGHAWRPTKAIIDWQFGHDDSVEAVSGEQARAFAPDAFPAVSGS